MGSAVPWAGGARGGVTRVSSSLPPHRRCSRGQQMAPRARRWRRTGTGTGEKRRGTGQAVMDRAGLDWTCLCWAGLGYTGLTALDFTGRC